MKIAVICGSIRSSLLDMRELETELTEGGWVVLFPVPLEVGDNDLFADAMHLQRVALAASMKGTCFVVPKRSGETGDSTSREMAFAEALEMPVTFCPDGTPILPPQTGGE